MGVNAELIMQPTDSPPEIYVSRPEQLATCLEHLSARRIFGFDTEFVGEETYHPRLCLVQVATADALYLIDPFSVGPLDAFWKLIVDPANLVIVHAGRQEVRLCQLWTGNVPGNLFDLQIAAGLVGFNYPLGHGTLVNQVLGIQIAKGETLTEWRDRPLTPQQIRYAFDDVRFLLRLWEALSARLTSLGRTEWAREEFSRLLSTETVPEQVAREKWQKLRGLGTLDRRRLAIVRELAEWREEVAAKDNRPARTVVRDDLLVEIARRNPTRERDLQVIRGIAKRYLGSIIEAVRRAQTLSLDECPAIIEREQDPPQVALVTSVLQAVLGDFCCRNQLTAGLVANQQEIRGLVRARMQGMIVPSTLLLTQGWRAQFILPHLIDVLEGRKSLRIVNLTGESPFAVCEVNAVDESGNEQKQRGSSVS